MGKQGSENQREENKHSPFREVKYKTVGFKNKVSSIRESKVTPLQTQNKALLMFSCTRLEHRHIMQTQKEVTTNLK